MYGHYTCRTSTLRRSTVHQGDFSDLVSLHFLPSCTMVGIPSTALLAQPSPDTLLAVAGLYLQLEKWNKWYISHARLGLLGDVDSADRNVLGLLPASVHTGQRVLPEQFVTWNTILSPRRQDAIYLMHICLVATIRSSVHTMISMLSARSVFTDVKYHHWMWVA